MPLENLKSISLLDLHLQAGKVQGYQAASVSVDTKFSTETSGIGQTGQAEGQRKKKISKNCRGRVLSALKGQWHCDLLTSKLVVVVVGESRPY